VARTIGLLTGGGDCPGLNAVIRAVVTVSAQEYGAQSIGFLDGWKGPLQNLTRPLTPADVRDLLPVGGTVLGSSRTNPFKVEGGVETIQRTLDSLGIDALVAIGGEDTLGVATKLVDLGVHAVGVPKTIDNDLSATDYTFGYDTAVSVAVEAVDRLRTTARSHHRVLVAEVMGRHAGWIALRTGIAGSAAAILIPEVPYDIDAVAEQVQQAHAKDGYAIVVTAEGALPAAGSIATKGGQTDAFGHAILGGAGETVARAIEERTGLETRASVFGHIQRGGSPTAYDRWLGTRLGVAAAQAVADEDWGQMVALRGTDIVRVPLKEATGTLKIVSNSEYAEAGLFFG
jgi:phosphofructokinase-like protein